jgi:hypothetical protein
VLHGQFREGDLRDDLIKTLRMLPLEVYVLSERITLSELF